MLFLRVLAFLFFINGLITTYFIQTIITLANPFSPITGLPHTQGIQGNSGNFKVEENLKETQGISGNFNLFFKLRETQGSFDFF